MFIGLLTDQTEEQRFSFLFYVFVGNVIILAFFILLLHYFKSPILAVETVKEPANSSRMVSMDEVHLEMKYISKENERLSIKEQTDQIAMATYFENLKILYGVYLGIFICFFTTLFIFPVLIFQLEVQITPAYKYLVFSLIFNIGDVSSRFFYSLRQAMNKLIIHFLCLIKSLFVLIFYFAVSNTSFIADDWVKLLLIFVFAFLHGFVCTAYYNIASNRFNGVADRYKSGNLASISLIMGLTIGGLCSYAW
jgi:hypothetical protein